MKDEREPVRFKGFPARVVATLELTEALASSRACRVTLPETGTFPLAIRPLRSQPPIISALSFRLPKSTPPGSYEGSIDLGEQRIPILVDVESRSSLRFIHPKFTYKGLSGARVRTQLTVLNRGNVSVTVPGRDTFCVFEDGGVARALYRGLAAENLQGARRIDHILDELAEAHGGLVRITINKGAGRLAPEEVRELEIDLHFPRTVMSGKTYRGTWSISGADLEVVIEIPRRSKAKRGVHAEK
jgi:hypothetical protein